MVFKKSASEDFLTFKFSAAGWYPGHGQIAPGPGYGRQVVPQVAKYGAQQVAQMGRYGVQPKYEQAVLQHQQYGHQQPQAVWNHQQQFGQQLREEQEEEEEEEEEDEGGDGAIPFYANHRAL